MKTLLVTTLMFVAVLSVNTLLAQTTVYVCSTNGAYGYCYGSNNTSTCAYNNCIRYGGETPYSILSVASKGYGAIAVGKSQNGAQVVGAAAGYQNLEDAKRRATAECSNRGGQNIYIANTFLDE
jgi:hypothetical protein